MKFFEHKDRRKALLIALLFHIVLVILCMFYGMPEHDPPLEPEEVLLELAWAGGASNGGAAAITPVEEVVEEVVQAEDAATQETESVSVPVGQSSTPTEKPPVETEPVKEPEPTLDPRLTDALGGINTNPSDSDANGDTSGPPGEGDGDKPGHGVFGGSGNGWALTGRAYEGGAVVAGIPDEEGIVVLKIWVDREGNVYRTALDLASSNTTSQKLVSMAEKAAKKAKFNKDPKASPEQRGTMTFVFKLE